MSSKVKCVFCKRDILKVNAFVEQTPNGRARYFCNQDHRDLWHNKNKYKPTVDNEQRMFLTDYIQELYLNEGYDKSEINWTLLMSQVKNMQEQYDYKYSGIKLTLEYMKDIENVNLFNEESKGSILNLVPYYYQKATNDWLHKRKIKNMVEDFDFDDEIKIMKISKNKNRKHKEININELS